MLRRLGNKKRLLPKLLPLFPEHITCFIDLFFGSGAVTFAMVDRAKYIIANDKDEEVFNLFITVKDHKEELVNALKKAPLHNALFQYWKKQEEHDCVWRAARFLYLSNFSLLGKAETFRTRQGNDKLCAIINIDDIFDKIQNVIFLNSDFHNVFKFVSFRNPEREKNTAFIYADPPYINTDNNYQEGFTEEDTRDLFEILVNSGIRFALSEFDNALVLELAKKYDLHVTEIGERQNLKNRRTEILITNYEPIQKQPLLFEGMSLN